MKRLLPRLILLLPVLLPLGACRSTQENENRLGADIFEDIPAPKEAIYRHEHAESFSFRGESFRCGRFLYDYSGRHADAVRFFNETMTRPPYSWELVRDTREAEGSAKLEFKKGLDTCVVDIDYVQRHASLGDTVTILIRVNCLR